MGAKEVLLVLKGGVGRGGALVEERCQLVPIPNDATLDQRSFVVAVTQHLCQRHIARRAHRGDNLPHLQGSTRVGTLRLRKRGSGRVMRNCFYFQNSPFQNSPFGSFPDCHRGGVNPSYPPDLLHLWGGPFLRLLSESLSLSHPESLSHPDPMK